MLTIVVVAFVAAIFALVLWLKFRPRPDDLNTVRNTPIAASPPPAPLSAASSAAGGHADELEQLWDLHQKGALTAEEYGDAKARLLSDVENHGDRTFEAVLTQTGNNKIGVIKLVRELTQLGLKEAKDAVEGGPYSLAHGLTSDQAARVQQDFAAVGARVDLR